MIFQSQKKRRLQPKKIRKFPSRPDSAPNAGGSNRLPLCHAATYHYETSRISGRIGMARFRPAEHLQGPLDEVAALPAWKENQAPASWRLKDQHR